MAKNGGATSSVAHITVGAVFSGLFRTGLDDANTQLTDGMTDPHYTLWASPDPLNLGPTTIACPVTDTTYNANDEASRWISPYAALGGVRGAFTYRTTFLLDSAVPTGAGLSASILAAGPTTLLLNGQPTGVANLTPAFPGPFRNLFSFTLTNGFVAGLNTLDFVVDNGTNAVAEMNRGKLRKSARCIVTGSSFHPFKPRRGGTKPHQWRHAAPPGLRTIFVNDVFYKHVALLELAAERKKLSHAGPKDVNREAELSG